MSCPQSGRHGRIFREDRSTAVSFRSPCVGESCCRIMNLCKWELIGGSRASAAPRGAGLPLPLRRPQWLFSCAMPDLPPRADDHHRNDHRRHDKAADPGHLIVATYFHRCGIGLICLARSSHGDGSVALRPANRHRDASLRNVPPKHGVDEVLAASPTRWPRYPTALSSSHSDSSPFNAHSSDGVGAA